ncbi:hypothetical protein CYMTET_14446 [Cymbomonas tetramitiformis]|uniref:Methyltransferase domain-containing protein n=1 Tax=Cymbomonas tetramitiformis TaxID=36881 RepID=A0AAE0GGC3_9CHLO|nr:hypothetical protein CYMTET_14446 [Cymbomonas tetramitiformis]
MLQRVSQGSNLRLDVAVRTFKVDGGLNFCRNFGSFRTQTLRAKCSDAQPDKCVWWSPPSNDELRWSSRKKLTLKETAYFEGDQVLNQLARAVCGAECVPRKELFEAAEVGVKIYEHFSASRSNFDYPFVVDLCAGHGLLAWVLLLLSHSKDPSLRLTALCIDRYKPPSAFLLEEVLGARWPALVPRFRFVEGDVRSVQANGSCLLVSVHACGELSDMAIELALAGGAPLALMPCCHRISLKHGKGNDPLYALRHKRDQHSSRSIFDPAPVQHNGGTAASQPIKRGASVDSLVDAMDNQRAERLRDAGFAVEMDYISRDITPKNRLIMAADMDHNGYRMKTCVENGFPLHRRTLPVSPWAYFEERSSPTNVL